MKLEIVFGISNLRRPIEYRSHKYLEYRSTQNNSEKKLVDAFLQQELQKFAGMAGQTNITQHKIVLEDDRPFKLRYATRQCEP